MDRVPEFFGTNVFDKKAMKERLPEDVYLSLEKTMEEGTNLDMNLAAQVAEAMKQWAIEKGATHFTHWFHPMTGVTAEKHDAFLSRDREGNVIMEFSGKELVMGEPDASSLPSGGLRATFEARGYTAWDPTSFAFIKNSTLCIPTAFCSYGGQALDKKTPLLRSMQALNKQAMRVLKLFGNEDVKYTRIMVGSEQEYFLIPQEMYMRRKDLMFTGRTLFGAMPPKGQEMNDHYFGALKPRVAEFMAELDKELWKLGIIAKTEHNETAPAQHELASLYTTVNIATDNNQLTMEIMQQIAKKHGMVCLLHDKPFEGVNGSGKHNNWSIATNTGVNLISPGETPHENAQFLIFLCAVIQATDDYQDLLRLAAATASNDHRLGAHEAPPAVVSLYIGDELMAVLESFENDSEYISAGQSRLKLGASVLPKLPKDTTDRNRTSPFAFTGAKFEFRMLGASDSIACINIMINTAVAESLRQYADRLEGAEDFNGELHCLIKDVMKKHKRILFNGNGYDEDWIREATEVRGLSNYPATPDAIPQMYTPKNLELFRKHNVYSEEEVRIRCDILLDNYCKSINIEALTMVDMARHEILPGVVSYLNELVKLAIRKKGLGIECDSTFEEEQIKELSGLTTSIMKETDGLEKALSEIKAKGCDITSLSILYKNEILKRMEELRRSADMAEKLTATKYWPYPTYSDLLFGVR